MQGSSGEGGGGVGWQRCRVVPWHPVGKILRHGGHRRRSMEALHGRHLGGEVGELLDDVSEELRHIRGRLQHRLRLRRLGASHWRLGRGGSGGQRHGSLRT